MRNLLFAFFLLLSLVGCSQNQRVYLIEGSIIEINEGTGEMVIEGPLTIKKSPKNPEREGDKLETNKYPIKVSHLEKYSVGQKVKVTVKSYYGKDSWDANNMNFDVEVVK
jgi:ribosomal protein L24